MTIENSQVRVLGINVANISLVAAADEIINAASEKTEATQFAFVNADCLNIAHRQPDYREMLQNVRVFGDGAGVRYACKLTGQQIVDNVNGTDLFPLLCEKAAAEGRSVYFLGGKPGVTDEALIRVSQRYPDLIIAGSQHGFFDANDTAKVIEDINRSGADILFVALGAPRQDLFIAENLATMKVGAAIGVGGLFDFLAGRVGRAPRLIRLMGLEWVVRWLNEPRRLLTRYLIGNPLFIWRVIRSGEVIEVDQQPVKTSTDEDFRLAGSRFDLWQDFEVLDAVTAKYTRGPRQPGSLSYWWHTRSYLTLKRFMDICASLTAILLLMPVFLITALAILLDDPGPLVFKQTRVGFRGRHFTMFKFRSMKVNADAIKNELMTQNESGAGVIFKMKKDPRITRVGRIIRKFSIDELPQLFNVLRGDMTLVGPRPPVPAEVAEYTLPQRGRLEVVPGITCIWQVSGRSDIDFVGQVDLDLQYIRQRSLFQDILLLLKTIPAVLMAKGAY